MTNLKAISKDQYSDRKWQFSPDYSFAAKDSVCPIVLLELPTAMVTSPVAFLYSEGQYILVAVQGLRPQTNLFVDANGDWKGKYVPAKYHGYPFVLASTSGDGENLILCIDEDSGLVDSDEADKLFFDDKGELSEATQDVMKFLSEAHNSRIAASKICQKLKDHGLLRTWSIEIKYDEGTHKVEGLFRIDEEAFNKLSNEAFIELRQAGALPVIYSQLLSIQHIVKLADMAQEQAKLEASS